MAEPFAVVLKREALRLASESQRRSLDLHARHRQLEAEIADTKQLILNEEASRTEAERFEPSDGHDYCCPRCAGNPWSLVRRVKLKAVDSDDDSDRLQCPACKAVYIGQDLRALGGLTAGDDFRNQGIDVICSLWRSSMAKKDTPPDRIRGFTSLADHEAATAEGRVATTELDGYALRRIYGTMESGGTQWSTWLGPWLRAKATMPVHTGANSSSA